METDRAGLDAVRLSDEEQLFPVGSPRLIGARGRKAKPSDLLKIPLLHLDARNDWSRWFEAAGITNAKPKHGPVLNSASMLIDAAVDGQGVALARTILAARDRISERSAGPAILRSAAIVKDRLDRLPRGGVYAFKNSDLPRLVDGGGCR